MSVSQNCPSCGSSVSDDALEGLCPDCLGKLVLGADAVAGSDFRVSSSETQTALTPSHSHSMGEGVRRTGEGQRFGDYELLSEIAHGGMGVVFKARHVPLHRTVAVKMIRADRLAREEDIRRFRTEAQAAAQLQHPNIVAIHEVGEVQGQHFYSMDYVAGQSLSQVAREKPLSPKQAARYVEKIAEAIHYAHQRGILHRDLKPSNVLIDENDEPRVADFGLAKLMAGDSEMTMSGTVMGSPSYMPPEQASGRSREVTVRSDVYSLGAILYDGLCGRPPFRAESTMETLRQVVEMEPVLPRVLNPRAPRDLETIVLKCLQKDSDKRYASAQELADELARFQRGEPIQARPVSRPEKLWRWGKRKPALAASIAVIVLTFCAGFAGVLWQWRQSERHRRLAEDNLYVTDMNLSQQALKASNLGRARQLLDRHRPHKRERDLRNWEWRYLWQQSASDALFVLGRESEPVQSVAVSADGKLVAAGGQNGSIKVWDIVARKEVVALQDHGLHARVAFSPTENVLAGNSSNGVVIVWDPISWKPRVQLQQGPGIQSIAFSPDGKLLALFDTDGTLGVWDWAQTNRIHTIRPIQQWRLTQHFGEIAFSFDGRWLAIGVDQILVYEVANGAELFRLPKSRSEITALAFSRDNKYLASAVGFGSSSISIWDLQERREVEHLTGHQGWVSSLAFSSDGKILVSGSADQTIRLWDAATWEQLSILRGHLNQVWTMAIPPAGEIVVSGDRDGSVLVWTARPRADRAPVQTVAGVRMNHFAPEGKALATIGAADFSRDGSRLAVIREDGTIGLWDTQSLTELKRERKQGTNNFALRYSITGKWLAVGENHGLIKLLDATTLAEQLRLNGHNFSCFPLRFMAGDQRLITCDTWGLCKLWDLIVGKEIGSWNVSSNFYSIAASADGKLVVTGLRDGMLTFWDTASSSAIESTAAHRQAINGIAFSPNGQLLLTGSAHGDAKVWDLRSRKSIATLQGHLRAVDDVACSGDGQRLVTSGSRSEALKWWDLSTRQELATLEANGEHFKNLCFSPDGSALIAITPSGTLHFWRAPSFKEIEQAENLTKQQNEPKPRTPKLRVPGNSL